MVVDLTAAGLVQGHLWQSEASWMESVRSSQVYWLLRTISGIPLLLGFLAFGWSLATGTLTEPASPPPEAAAAVSPREPTIGVAWLHNAYVITALAGVGFFGLSFFALAMLPNREMAQEIAQVRSATLPGLSAAEQRGRQIYAREGCMNCHSQLIRKTQDDVRRFGVPSQAWEYENDLPHLWGTRRIGPDLARLKGRRTRDWHLAHLWNPRHVVPDSVMPAFPWLFEDSPRKPTQEALDLVAYMESLGRDAELAGLNVPRSLDGMDPAEEKQLGMFCDCDIPRTKGPAPVFTIDLRPGERQRLERRGTQIFARECSGCHGAAGKGDGPAAESLLIAPRDLTAARFSEKALSRALWFGVPGAAMSDFHELPTGELRALIAHVQSLEAAVDPEVAMTAKEKAAAEALYRQHCFSCHGEGGQGNGLYASTLAPAPTNFREVRPSLASAQRTLEIGTPGTAMISWKNKLTEDERTLLARYVRSFFRAD